MTVLLRGKEVAEALTEESIKKIEALKEKGITPTLGIMRVGDNPSDKAYEMAAIRRADFTGVKVKQFVYDKDIKQRDFIREIKAINKDDSIHGVLIFRPLPSQIDDAKVCMTLNPAKDVDGITPGSMGGVFIGNDFGFPPCTAQACMELLDYKGIDLTGKKVTVIGRSLVVGKPVAMMALQRNATVTTLHSRTEEEDFIQAGQNADVVIAAIGKPKLIDVDRLGENQIILDVGTNITKDGSICGDVNFENVKRKAEAITPVPGGIGSITTAVLMKHVVQAAEACVK